MDNNILKEVGFVEVSQYRTRVLASVVKSPKIPTEIAKDCNYIANNISNTLKELSDHNLVVCINPEMRKGRVYKVTDYGQKIYNEIFKNH